MFKNIMFFVVIGLVLGITYCASAQETAFYAPFYFPYTAESDQWFQSFYHPFTQEQKKVIPFFAVRQEYDDNVFLDRHDSASDWITNLQAGLVLQPNLGKNKFVLDYLGDFNLFANHNSENNDNHTVTTGLQLNFNKSHLDIINVYRDFSDRSGSEDVSRIDRNSESVWPSFTFNFAKMDVLVGYNYRLEKYNSDDAIGTFEGKNLTYKNLDREEQEITLETALKIWPKTALLVSVDSGTIDHRIENGKPDSNYYDVMTGLRGSPFAKSTVEGKIGFSGQDYDNYEYDYRNAIFSGSWLEKLSERDALRFDCKRTTNDSTFQDNGYYVSTFFGADFKHDFTEKLAGRVGCSYEFNNYPTEVSLDNMNEDKREDEFWSPAIGVEYKLSKYFIADLKFNYIKRDSNFSRYDYQDNRISAGIKGSF
ncbi:MAG: outer membrane beta-barrel protein [Candidatus Omnitrophica bacterium]|nr:outer membrane beta-barrel protein [Candidatus Omnitrophota bacterium]